MKEDSEAMEEVNRLLQAVLKKMESIDSRLRVMASKAETKKSIVELSKLKEKGNYFEYVEAFVELASMVELSDEDLVARFVEGLENENHKLIAILKPKTLQQAISFGRALTLDVDPNATSLEDTSVVAEVKEPNGMIEGKEPVQLSIAKEGRDESDDLRLQDQCRPYQRQNHKPLIYQPPHRRPSPAETEEMSKEMSIANSFMDKCGRLGTAEKDRREVDDFDCRNINTDIVNSDENVAEKIKKLNSTGKIADPALDLVVATHNGFSEEMVILSAAPSAAWKFTAWFGKPSSHLESAPFKEEYKNIANPLGTWTSALKNVTLTSLETSAAMEFYQKQWEPRLLNEFNTIAYERADRLGDKWGTEVHTYFCLDENSEKGNEARYQENEWASGFTGILKILDSSAIIDGKCVRVSSPMNQDKTRIVWNPGSKSAIGNGGGAEKGYPYGHSLTVIPHHLEEGVASPSNGLNLFKLALNGVLRCHSYDAFIRDHATPLSVLSNEQLTELIGVESEDAVPESVGMPNDKYINITSLKMSCSWEDLEFSNEHGCQESLGKREVSLDNHGGLISDFSIKQPELVGSHGSLQPIKKDSRGGSRMVWGLLVMAREHSPSIISWDEADRVESGRMVIGSSHGGKEAQGIMWQVLNHFGGTEAPDKTEILMATGCIDTLDQALLWFRWMHMKVEFLNLNERFRLGILKSHSGKIIWVREITGSLQGKGFEALYGYSPPISLPYVDGRTINSGVKQGLLDRDAMSQLRRSYLPRVQQRMAPRADKKGPEHKLRVSAGEYEKPQPYKKVSGRKRDHLKLDPWGYGPYCMLHKNRGAAHHLQPSMKLEVEVVLKDRDAILQLPRELKKSLKEEQAHFKDIPTLNDKKGVPEFILDQTLVKGNRAASKVLVQWAKGNHTNAAGKFPFDLQAKCSYSTLGDKGAVKEGVLIREILGGKGHKGN